MKIKDYVVVDSHYLDCFHEEIKSKLENGWQPLGGIAVTVDKDQDYFYFQAMVKYED